MAQKLCPFSTRQFEDANGVPYSGAKLFVYLAGTTTKTTVTKDLAGTADHANPIILNARGEPGDGAGSSKAIWQTDGVPIKLVLAPSTDTDPPVSAISEWDNIEGVNDTEGSGGGDQWIVGPTPIYVSATSFTLVGDQSSDFHIGRRVMTTNSGGTIYSTITAVAFTSLTTVTVTNDSGTLDSGLSAVSYGLLTATNNVIPGGTHEAATTFDKAIIFSDTATFNKSVYFSKGADKASAAALTLGTDGNYFDVTGTTAITSIVTVKIGTVVKLHFDGALVLTHHATDLVLPGAANITTAAGDEVELVEYATGDWRLVSYTLANGYNVNLGTLSQQDNLDYTDLTNPPVGTTYLWNRVGGTTTSATYVRLNGFISPFTATVRLRVGVKLTGAGTVAAKIYIDGVAAGTERGSTSGAYAENDEDIAISIGEEVEIWGKNPTATSAEAYMELISTDEPFFLAIAETKPA